MTEEDRKKKQRGNREGWGRGKKAKEATDWLGEQEGAGKKKKNQERDTGRALAGQ